MPITKVLVANRGEIAVRVIRAARDAGLPSVAVYADPDADSLFVKLADEAFALNGMTPAETYLDVAKILAIAERTGANAIHPGYGFLAENADFAQAVLDAGLIWIGPPPAAIDALGDKVKARHIETQCLADSHGNGGGVSTRDCSLQRRHQKLVEEAPAPFLTDEQIDRLYTSSKAILKEAGYIGAGTCEFLVAQDGRISFLEVNTRLQVEHPVSEEVTGIDLVREMFRIADGEELGYGDPEVRGHSIEFRINAEDAGRNFMPAPGTLTAWQAPSGPGVRVDHGYNAGMSVPGSFDSLVAKIIVTGADREQAIARSRRALSETVLEGMPTVIPFHQTVLDEPDYEAVDGNFKVHTRWIETEFDNQIPAYTGPLGEGEEVEKTSVVVEVNGRRVEVKLPASLGTAAPAASGKAKKPTRRDRGGAKASAPSSNAVASPMQGTIVKVAVSEGDTVAEGDLVVVLEAMKMEQPLNAHRAGVIKGLKVEAGQTVASGDTLCEIVDAE